MCQSDQTVMKLTLLVRTYLSANVSMEVSSHHRDNESFSPGCGMSNAVGVAWRMWWVWHDLYEYGFIIFACVGCVANALPRIYSCYGTCVGYIYICCKVYVASSHYFLHRPQEIVMTVSLRTWMELKSRRIC